MHGDVCLCVDFQFIDDMDKSPYFAELPFRIKAQIYEPAVDMRIAATNLMRALKPCTAVVKAKPPPQATAQPSSTPPAMNALVGSNLQVLGRGFL